MSQDVREEIWKPIEGFEDLYMDSDKGRVKSLRSGKVLKPGVDRQGYKYINLSEDGKFKQCYIHRLVANAFLPNPNNLPEVNHIDECKTNNDVTNLSWCTASQNIRHSIHQQSCKVNQLTLDGEFIREWKSFREIERELGYSNSHIIKCCKGKMKKAYGFKWSYTDGLNQRKYNRSVIALTKDGEFVAEYKSAAEASRYLNIYVNCIRLCLKGVTKTTHGLKFKYADEQ